MERSPPSFDQQEPLSQINYRAFMVIMKEWDTGGENWLTQIRDGFPITGRIRNDGVLLDVTDIPGKLSRKESCGSPPKRWTELESVIRQDADIELIWLTFQEEVRRKWFSTPIPVIEFRFEGCQSQSDDLSFIKTRKLGLLIVTSVLGLTIRLPLTPNWGGHL